MTYQVTVTTYVTDSRELPGNLGEVLSTDTYVVSDDDADIHMCTLESVGYAVELNNGCIVFSDRSVSYTFKHIQQKKAHRPVRQRHTT